MQQPSAFAGGENNDGIRLAGSAEIGAFEGIDGDVHCGECARFIAHSGADFFADEKHGSFVAFAFANDDGAVHANRIHFRAHGLDGHLIGFVAVPETHGMGRSDGGLLHYAQEFQTECFLHYCS